jgi:hypothetical protein
VAVAAAVALANERRAFFDAYHRLGVAAVLAAFVAGAAGVLATFMMWRTVLHGLGANLSFRIEIRLFFVTQLGKYAPGAVWPALMQMEAGKSHRASRAQMLAANLMTIVLGCCVGLVVAVVTLPFYAASSLGRYWWLLVALPFLLALIHPRSFPALLNIAARVLRRPPLAQRLRVQAEAAAAAWSLASWGALGLQVAILASKASGGVDVSVILLSVGGMALATTVGVLAIPVPAGAGIREVVLGLVLSRVMPPGTALAVVVSSRVLLTLADVALAATVSPIRNKALPDP